MTRPKFFRDPIHLQIRFDPVLLEAVPVNPTPDQAVSWLLRKLIDTQSFQRLRLIRQNGLANYVFHGMEHSRFSHSMGVSYLARSMFARINRNLSQERDPQHHLDVAAASLLHDIGHGPFSHTLEHVLGDLGIEFDHEVMTENFITDQDCEVGKILSELDGGLAGRLVPYFDKKKRKQDHWTYKIVSSQMDADRLDYVQRDATFAGLRGHGFDIERIFDLLGVHDGTCIAVDRGAIEAVEAYLVMIDQLYRAIYYHKAVRSAAQMFSSAVRRAVTLFLNGDKLVFPTINGNEHPLVGLVKQGEKVPLASYVRLTDATVWFLLDIWSSHPDKTLAFLSLSILKRDLFKTISITETSHAKVTAQLDKAREIASKHFSDLSDAGAYLVAIDEPSRTSYKGYDFGRDAFDESIWLTGDGKADRPLEDTDESKIVSALKQVRYFPRLVVPKVVKDELTKS